jgi:hypothetical protein
LPSYWPDADAQAGGVSDMNALYSLYIWQQLAFMLSARFPIAVCLAFLSAVVSYYEVEASFNALRRRWT